MSKTKFTLRIETNTWEKVKEIADSKGQTGTDFVRDAIAAKLEKESILDG